MRKFDLGNGHTIAVETANRGLEDDYKITFFEDGKQLGPSEYGNKDYIEYFYGVTLLAENTSQARYQTRDL